MDKVSIIMPCYNDGKYIEKSIESAMLQSYSNIELIIVDDGSDDKRTLQILSKQQDVRIKILHIKYSKPAAARNMGISIAERKYILPLDADDLIEQEYVKKAVSIMELIPDIGIVYCQADLFGQELGRWNLPDYSLDKMLVVQYSFI